MIRYQFMRFPGGRPKAFTLSYDDDVATNVRFADTISSYGLKCTFNLNLPSTPQLPEKDIREHIVDAGHEIAVHGKYHRAEGSQRPVDAIRDVLDCRLGLEQTYGRIVRGMAYPDTGIRILNREMSYERIKSYLTDLDIAYARSLGGDNDRFELPLDFHAWMPNAHHDNPEIFSLIDKFLALDFSENTYQATLHPRLLYIWGHSYEFDRKNNWEHLDRICERIAHRDDIWYATNGEIYDYVKAYESLVWSADGTMVYNPTLHELFFVIDRKPYCVKPGETLRIEA